MSISIDLKRIEIRYDRYTLGYGIEGELLNLKEINALTGAFEKLNGCLCMEENAQTTIRNSKEGILFFPMNQHVVLMRIIPDKEGSTYDIFKGIGYSMQKSALKSAWFCLNDLIFRLYSDLDEMKTGDEMQFISNTENFSGIKKAENKIYSYPDFYKMIHDNAEPKSFIWTWIDTSAFDKGQADLDQALKNDWLIEAKSEHCGVIEFQYPSMQDVMKGKDLTTKLKKFGAMVSKDQVSIVLTEKEKCRDISQIDGAGILFSELLKF